MGGAFFDAHGFENMRGLERATATRRTTGSADAGLAEEFEDRFGYDTGIYTWDRLYELPNVK